MASIYDFKPKFQALLRPGTTWLFARGVTANQITLLAVAISFACGGFILRFPNASWPLLLVPVTLFIRMAMNAIDGMLAREFDQKSRLGAILNEVGDVVSDAALYLPFAVVAGPSAASVVVFVLLAVTVEFVGVSALQVGSDRRYDGPMGKSDRAFWVGLLAVMLAFGLPSVWASGFVWVLAFLSFLTVLNRASRALETGEHSPYHPDRNTMLSIAHTALANEARVPTEHSFTASDGQEIFYRVWQPVDPVINKNAVLLFHRGHEHSGRWQEFVDTAEMNDCWFFAWDARGHGLTDGPRGAAESFSRMVADADEFARHLCDEHDLQVSDFGVVGQSVGAVLAAAWIHDYAPPVRAMVLATPAFRIKLYVPLAIPGLRVLNKLRPGSFIRSYVRPSLLTRDKAQADAYADDPLVSPKIAVNILLDLHDTSTRLLDDASAIHTPTKMFVSGRDYVVSQSAQHQFFDGLSSTDKQIDVLSDFYHSTFWEDGRQGIIKQSADFLQERFRADSEPLDSERLAEGSFAKYTALQGAPSQINKSWFDLQSFALNTVGRLSKGVRIGWESGFDSGQSLDHVYRNRAEGTAIVGKLIDRGYLESIGWKGIRQRKVHMENLLDTAIEQAVKEFGKVTIMDIAAGPGRYVLETLKRNESLPVEAILCDRDAGGISEGRVIAKELGLTDQVRFERSDAFDPKKIQQAAAGKAVHIAIVSGLYELFPSNEMVSRSLAGLNSVIVDDGWLLYTDQPWHPQQEMIARVLPNRDGDPWIMRCRSQAEMDALVREAGLQRERLLLDRWGIFSVALARK